MARLPTADRNHASGPEPAALDSDLAAAQPRGSLERDVMRAKIGEALFGEPAAPVRMGRFVILDRLGEGGMGVVYSAYDPELDRRVALKLLRAGTSEGDARERLLREAQALARLSHPNVVPVHDVGVLDNQVFIVMEFVAGQTLRAWLHAKERSWRDILDVYCQAGQGLAAAHAVDLVHRDVKPDNALVGDDGRVRVVDFGLVRGHGDAPATDAPLPPGQEMGRDGSTRDGKGKGAVTARLRPARQARSADTEPTGGTVEDSARDSTASRPGGNAAGKTASQGRIEHALTRTGTRMGTPAYMSPEQFSSARVGPASDQFSFCAALYEALYGNAPFAGNSLAEREQNIRAGAIREPSRKSRVPGWILPVVSRGLRADPSQRHASMHALLARLGRDPARARKRWLGATLALLLVAVSSYSLAHMQSRPAVAVCQDAGPHMAAVWNESRRQAVQNALIRTGRAYAEPAWKRVDAGLANYAQSWIGMHTDACMSHQRGEQSDLLLDRRMACLDDRRDALQSAISVLEETDKDSLQHAVDVVQRLPDIGYCGRLDALAAEVPPPKDANVAARIATLRRRLNRTRALEHAGRYQAGLDLARIVAREAESLAYEPLVAEALLVEGRIAMNMRAFDRAVAALDRAAHAALGAGMDAVAVEALARRIYAGGIATRHSQEIDAYLGIGEALGRRIPDNAFVHALLVNNAGAVYMARGQRDRARDHFERALAIVDKASNRARDSAAGPLPIELVNVVKNLAMVTADDDQRAALIQRALSELEQTLGANHPMTLATRTAAGMYRSSPARAYQLLAPACAAYQRYHPESVERVAKCHLVAGLVQNELGHADRAAEHMRQVADILAPGSAGSDVANPELENPDLAPVYHLARGHALLHKGERKAAFASLQTVVELVHGQPDPPWWQQRYAAQARLAMGASERAQGRLDRAMHELEQALPVFEHLVTLNQNAAQQRDLAWTRANLAMALWQASTSQTRARELMDRAERWYRDAGAGYEQRLAELATWRHTHGMNQPGATD